MNNYQQRDETLSRLGFASYSEYLASTLWESIRRRVLCNRNTCRCGSQASQVHHRNYSEETLSGRSMSGLESICGECHKLIELDGDKKRTLKAANAMLDKIIVPEVQPQKRKNKSKKKRGWKNSPVKFVPDCQLCRDLIAIGCTGSGAMCRRCKMTFVADKRLPAGGYIYG